MTEQEFEQAVVRIRSGDKDGLKEIYLAYVRFIYAVIYEILQNKENTEDMTSEFFIKLWDMAERYEPGRGHRGYLATIARNMAIDFLRKRRREVLSADLDLGGFGGGGGAFDTSGGGSVEADGGIAGGNAHSRAGGSNPGRMYQRETSANPVEDEVIGNIALKEALAFLKDGERQIINMKILGDMTFQEISDTLQMPMGTVTWKYRNAIGKLRRCGYEQGFET